MANELSQNFALREARLTSAEQSRQFLTSNRRVADQLPALPDELIARARHHMVSVGRVLLLNCDAVTFLLTMGDEKVFWSSI